MGMKDKSREAIGRLFRRDQIIVMPLAEKKQALSVSSRCLLLDEPAESGVEELGMNDSAFDYTVTRSGRWRCVSDALYRVYLGVLLVFLIVTCSYGLLSFGLDVMVSLCCT